MNNKISFALIIAVIILFSNKKSMAQDPLEPRLSPLEVVTLKYDDTYVKITYGRPHKRGRDIFGNPELVPYGEVWRTGANEATEITVTKDIIMAGNTLKAGTYTLFTIPEKNKWTIILNSELGQWGAYNYDPDHDVMRFTVPVQKTEVIYEPFTIEFEQHDHSADLLMMWDTTKVVIPLKFPD